MKPQIPQESSIMPAKKITENKIFPSKLKSILQKSLIGIGEVLFYPVAIVVCIILSPLSLLYYIASIYMNQTKECLYLPTEKRTFCSKLKSFVKDTFEVAPFIFLLPLFVVFGSC